MQAKDYLIEIKVRNNLLLSKMRACGFESVAQLARACDVSQHSLGRLANLKDTPINKNGDWKFSVISMSRVLKCLPEDLFPAQHLEKALKRNTAKFEASAGDVSGFLSGNSDTARMAIEHIIDDENVEEIGNILEENFTERELRVLKYRYGIGCDEKSLEEVGKEFNVTRERIRQIEARALRKLKLPHNSRRLREIGLTMDVFTPNHRWDGLPQRHYIPEWKRGQTK